MTVHVLHAGDGYTYLTRQVASGDVERGRGQDLADYYTAQGAPPGRWSGRGATALGMSGQVTEAHMKALFGEGLRPDADERISELIRSGMDASEAIDAVRLGRKFPRFTNDNPFQNEVDQACQTFARELGDWPRFDDKLAIEQRIARERLAAAGIDGVPSEGAVSEYIRSQRRTERQPVAGYDLVFTPAKSISVLWGLGDYDIRRAVAEAHAAAVDRSMEWVETECGFTRRGSAGVEQIASDGLTVARFDHFDNRAGDPNLHTHCAVSNRVLSEDGKWRALDARVLHRAAVAASETYNLAVEDELCRRLPGVRFTATERGSGKRPVREIDGIDRGLCVEFSRRPSIERRLGELAREYRRRHGTDPSKEVQYKLAQQATLETREGKAKARSLAEMREEWAATAERLLGPGGISAMVTTAVAGASYQLPAPAVIDPDAVAADVIDRVGRDRADWTRFHVVAQVARELAGHRFATVEERSRWIEQITDVALAGHSVLVSAPDVDVPASMRRQDGQSVLTQHCSRRYSSATVLAAERSVLDATGVPTALVLPATAVTEAAEQHRASEGFGLNDGQLALAHHFAGSGALVAAGVGPAGTGKTTSMQVVARAWEASGRRIVALGPSARAADVLGDELGTIGRTLADVLTRDRHGLDCGIGAGDMVLLDEAGMAATRDISALVTVARQKGAVVRLLGDPQQLAAVESGGLLRDVAEQTGAPELREIHRFTDPAEAAATLALRRGEKSITDWYTGQGRVTTGLSAGLVEDVLSAHQSDLADGVSALMIAADNETVRALNERAHLDHLAAAPEAASGATVRLSDGLTASPGDRIVTRRNDRRLRPQGASDPAAGNRVRNGDLWTVTQIEPDGSLTAVSAAHGGTIRLPAEYVAQFTELGYAATIHRAQGMTVDRCRVLVSPAMTRQALYVAASRGRLVNQLYVPDDELPDVEQERPDPETPPAVATLRAIIGRDGADATAHRARDEERQAARSLPTLAGTYAAMYDRIADALAHHLLDGRVPDSLAAGAQWRRARAILTIAARTDAAPGHLVDAAVADLGSEWDEVQFCDRLVTHARAHRQGSSPAEGLWRAVGATALPRLQEGIDLELHAAASAALERLDHACAVVARDAGTPSWAQNIPSATAETAGDRDHLIAEIAVWRTFHQIPDTETSPLPTAASPDRTHARLHDRLTAYRAAVLGGTNPLAGLDDHALAQRQTGLRTRIATARSEAATLTRRIAELEARPAEQRARRDHQRLVETAGQIQSYADLAAERDRLATQGSPTGQLDRRLLELRRALPPAVRWAEAVAGAGNAAEQHARLATAIDSDTHALDQARARAGRLAADLDRDSESLNRVAAELAARGSAGARVPTRSSTTTPIWSAPGPDPGQDAGL